MSRRTPRLVLPLAPALVPRLAFFLVLLLVPPAVQAHGVQDGDTFPPNVSLDVPVGADGSDLWLHRQKTGTEPMLMAFNHRVHADEGTVRFRVSAEGWNHTWDHQITDAGATEFLVAPPANEYRVEAWSPDGQASRWATIRVATPCACLEQEVDPVLFPSVVLFAPQGPLSDPPVADTAFYSFDHETLCVLDGALSRDACPTDSVLAVRSSWYDPDPAWAEDYERWYPESLARLRPTEADAEAPGLPSLFVGASILVCVLLRRF